MCAKGGFEMNSLLRRMAAVAWVVTGLGCALTPRGMARDIATVSPPAAINSTLRALNDDENQRLMVQLLSSPEMHQAARGLAGEIADGTMEALTEPERIARIEAMSTRYMEVMTRALIRSMAQGMRRDMAPVIAAMMRETVATTMREALSEGYQRDLERVAGGLTRATVESASRAMAEGISRDLVPSIRTALLNEQTANALGAASRSLAREVVLGSNDAMTQLQHQQERTGRTSFLSRISSLTEDGVTVMRLVAIIAGSLALALGAWVARLIFKGRRVQAESERNAASAVMFAEAIRAAEGKPWSKELTDLLHERLKGEAVAGMIDEVLQPKPTRGGRGAKRNTIPSPRHA
ncbi:MAG: hypothetical protein JWM10_3533 [Myxococcaceae bacterium]|nr:hypothetical protein [Myxococcaceae bacterium]